MSVPIIEIKPIEFGFHQDEKVNTSTGNIPFQSILTEAINQTNQATAVTQQDGVDLLLGNVDNLAQVQINSLKASTMLQTTVQLTSRVVNAYKEIMQMQI